MLIELTNAQVQDLGELYEDDPLELNGFTYTLYEESDEINEHKYVHWDRIYKRNDDKFFLQSCSKSGSYWSDYEYYYGDSLCEVKQVEFKKLEWKLV